MGAHTTNDDPTKYRLSDELEHWKLKDPIARVKAYLVRNALADEDFFAKVEADADTLAEHIRTSTRAMPDPDPAKIFDLVYEEQTPELLEQKEWFVKYHASFASQAEVH
jgi:pyruvate dehydrogenase E1 component alpha subunit